MKKKIMVGVGLYLAAGAITFAMAWKRGTTRSMKDALTFVPLWPMVAFNAMKTPAAQKLDAIVTTSRAILPEHGRTGPVVDGVRAPPDLA